jgi:hypothetical protein
MQSAKEKSRTVFENCAAILMARLVDACGLPIQPADIRAIDCTIYEIDPCWPHSLTLVNRYNAVFLAVAAVVFDSLQTDELWSVDDVGYNFRHEINFDGHERFPKPGFQYQVRYGLTNAHGERTIVRFTTSPPGRGENAEPTQRGQFHDRHPTNPNHPQSNSRTTRGPTS